MISMRKVIVAVGLLAGTMTAQASDFAPYIEPVLGLQGVDGGLTFIVEDDFCTSKADYEVVAETDALKQVNVTLIRITPRICDGYNPAGIALHFTASELGGQQG